MILNITNSMEHGFPEKIVPNPFWEMDGNGFVGIFLGEI